MRRRQVVRGLVPTFALWLAFPHPLHAQGATLVAVAEAYTAAWNAHDLPAVLARFAPDAVVRERRGAVPAEVWDSRDPQVVRAYLRASYDGEVAADDFAWVTGHPQIAAWAAAHFKLRHRYVAGQHRAAGDTVSWPYREFSDPFQLLPGVGPAEGDAEAVVRDGRITRLTLLRSPASAQRQQGEAEAARVQAEATQRAAPLGDGLSLPRSGPPRAAEPTDPAWPVALGGLALLAVGAATLRRRQRRSGVSERNTTAPSDPMQP